MRARDVSRAALAAAMLAPAVLAGCDDPPPGPRAASSSAAAPPPSSVAAGPMAPPPASASGATTPAPPPGRLEVLKLVITSNVRDKDPVDRVVTAGAGERVFAHVTLRNRTGADRRVRLTCRVNDKTRSDVELDVESSWSYRTWAYCTLKATEKKGELAFQITGEEGLPLAEARVPIGAKMVTREKKGR